MKKFQIALNMLWRDAEDCSRQHEPSVRNQLLDDLASARAPAQDRVNSWCFTDAEWPGLMRIAFYTSSINVWPRGLPADQREMM